MTNTIRFQTTVDVLLSDKVSKIFTTQNVKKRKQKRKHPKTKTKNYTKNKVKHSVFNCDKNKREESNSKRLCK